MRGSETRAGVMTDEAISGLEKEPVETKSSELDSNLKDLSISDNASFAGAGEALEKSGNEPESSTETAAEAAVAHNIDPLINCRCGCVPNIMSLFQMAELRARRRKERERDALLKKEQEDKEEEAEGEEDDTQKGERDASEE